MQSSVKSVENVNNSNVETGATYQSGKFGTPDTGKEARKSASETNPLLLCIKEQLIDVIENIRSEQNRLSFEEMATVHFNHWLEKERIDKGLACNRDNDLL